MLVSNKRTNYSSISEVNDNGNEESDSTSTMGMYAQVKSKEKTLILFVVAILLSTICFLRGGYSISEKIFSLGKYPTAEKAMNDRAMAYFKKIGFDPNISPSDPLYKEKMAPFLISVTDKDEIDEEEKIDEILHESEVSAQEVSAQHYNTYDCDLKLFNTVSFGYAEISFYDNKGQMWTFSCGPIIGLSASIGWFYDGEGKIELYDSPEDIDTKHRLRMGIFQVGIGTRYEITSLGENENPGPVCPGDPMCPPEPIPLRMLDTSKEAYAWNTDTGFSLGFSALYGVADLSKSSCWGAGTPCITCSSGCCKYNGGWNNWTCD